MTRVLTRVPTSRLVALATALAVALALLPLAGAARAQQAEARDISDACPEDIAESDFTDRPAEEAFAEAVDCILHWGITRGVTATEYRPLQQVTRGQMASFIVRSLQVANVPLPAPKERAFDDVPADHPHAENINILAAIQPPIAAGFPDGSFRPDPGACTGPQRQQNPQCGLVSRAQMASFIARQVEFATGEELPAPEDEGDYFDDDNGDTHEDNINKLAEAGVVQGVGERRYEPLRIVNRGQMALFLARSLDYLVEEGGKVLSRIGVTTVLDGPELVSAAVVGTPGETATVRFVFDAPVAPGSVVASSFRLAAFTGVAGGEGGAQSATPVGGDPNAFDAVFSRSLYDTATTAYVVRGAVQDAGGRLVPEGSAPLQTVELPAGATAAPDLREVTIGADSATFSFDQPAHDVDEERFHLVLHDGTVLDGSGDATGEGTTEITVAFTGTQDAANPVRRAYVREEAVASSDEVANPRQAVSLAATQNPDLVAVTIDPANDRVFYQFDQAVEPIPASLPPLSSPPGGFRIFYLDGSEAEAGEWARSAAPNTIVAQFDTGEVSNLVAGGSVAAGTVRSPAATERVNQVDSAGVALTFAAGRTAAPDLIGVARGAVDGSNRRVVFIFDQPVAANATFPPETRITANGFSLYTADSNRIGLSGCNRGDDPNQVVCTAPAEAVDAAVLASVHEGSVRDLSGAHFNYAASRAL
jgi:hypothetical protein